MRCKILHINRLFTAVPEYKTGQGASGVTSILLHFTTFYFIWKHKKEPHKIIICVKNKTPVLDWGSDFTTGHSFHHNCSYLICSVRTISQSNLNFSGKYQICTWKITSCFYSESVKMFNRRLNKWLLFKKATPVPPVQIILTYVYTQRILQFTLNSIYEGFVSGLHIQSCLSQVLETDGRKHSILVR